MSPPFVTTFILLVTLTVELMTFKPNQFVQYSVEVSSLVQLGLPRS